MACKLLYHHRWLSVPSCVGLSGVLTCLLCTSFSQLCVSVRNQHACAGCIWMSCPLCCSGSLDVSQQLWCSYSYAMSAARQALAAAVHGCAEFALCFSTSHFSLPCLKHQLLAGGVVACLAVDILAVLNCVTLLSRVCSLHRCLLATHCQQTPDAVLTRQLVLQQQWWQGCRAAASVA